MTKKFACVLYLMLTSVAAYCQDIRPAKPYGPPLSKRILTPEEYGLEVVKHLMEFPSPLKNGSIQLHRMGDRAARYILEVLKTKDPLNDAEMRTVLDIIHQAYGKPQAIMQEENRKSTASTVALLQQLGGSTQASAIRMRAVDEHVFVSTVASAALPLPEPSSGGIGPPPEPGSTPFR